MSLREIINQSNSKLVFIDKSKVYTFIIKNDSKITFETLDNGLEICILTDCIYQNCKKTFKFPSNPITQVLEKINIELDFDPSLDDCDIEMKMFYSGKWMSEYKLIKTTENKVRVVI